MDRLTVRMRSYKTYLIFIFVPYLLLIAMFHSQLPFQDSDLDPHQLDTGSRSHPRSAPDFSDRTFRFRDLMINQGNSLKLHMDLDANHLAPLNNRVSQVDHGPNAGARVIIHRVSKNSSQILNSKPVTTMTSTGSNVNQPVVNVSKEHRTVQPTVSMPLVPGCSARDGATAVNFSNIQSHYVYTAYYDDRMAMHTYIRVIALLRKSDKPVFYCHIPKDSSSKEYVITPLNYYEMCENHAKDYGGWILSCDVPETVKVPPCEVTVSLHSTHQTGDKFEVTIPVFVTKPQQGQAKRDFGVCIPPLFGHIPSTTLVEFIELTQILGAVHFTFYVHEVALEMTKVLRYYKDRGLVSMIPWQLPVRSKAIWYHGQLLAINDCLYRNMHAFQYVAFNDIDEFVVPHRMSNWSSMVQQLLNPVLDQDPDDINQDFASQQHNFCGFTFQSAFFDPMLTMGSAAGHVLYDLESDLRTKSFSRVRTKAMVDPSRIYELGIHHISKPLTDYYRTYYVDPGDAFLHHYRKCITDFDPKMNCQIFSRDESLSRYIPTLRHNVHQTLWVLKEMDNLKGQGHKNTPISNVGQNRGV